MQNYNNLLGIILNKDKNINDFINCLCNSDNLDLECNNDELFFESCLNDKLDIAKYIYDKKNQKNYFLILIY